MNSTDLEEIKEDPMGDDDIRFYFPSAKIIKYADLARYPTFEKLLPKDKDFSFLLLENSPNKGHWLGLLKYNDTAEVFDSYGGKPDSWLSWNSKDENQELGQDSKELTRLLKTFKGKVVYNPIKYQGEGNDINTCGRHCTLRVKKMREGKNLDQYYTWLKSQKEGSGKDYDDIVSFFIQRV